MPLLRLCLLASIGAQSDFCPVEPVKGSNTMRNATTIVSTPIAEMMTLCRFAIMKKF